jgi:hypothetical protein
MADPRGKRSVQVNVFNHTEADLTVQGPSLGSSCSWISGQQPNQGDTLAEFAAANWGVTTNDATATAQAWISLSGLGSPMINISVSNDHNGNTLCTATGNSVVNVTTQQQTSGEDAHAVWNITLGSN